LDHLAPSIANGELLALLGKILETDPTPDSTSTLRLRFFQPGSWQALLDLAISQDVLPALIFSLKQRCLLPPVPATAASNLRTAHVTTWLEAAYRQHLERQTDLREQLAAVLAALNRQGIVPALLKGAVHLTLSEPPWHEARSMRDIDMLVRTSEAPNANTILQSIGYVSDRDPPPLDRHLPELRFPGRCGTIEIHMHALAFSARRMFTTEELWARTEERVFAGATLRVLPREWHLFHGMLHHQIADRGHARRLLAIKGLWEFAMVGNGLSPQAWNSVVDHAKERGVIDVLASWASQANRLFGFKIPSELPISDRARAHADATFSRTSAPYEIRWAYFTADKLRFAFRRETLAVRYGLTVSDGLTKAALRHLIFLTRRYGSQAAQWLQRQTRLL
jgi:hypothetical protein